MPEKNIDGSTSSLGRHLTIEYYDCGPDTLLDKDSVEKAILRAASDSGATIVSSSFHHFTPQGVSGVVIIAESHFTIHAWPEHNYAAVDIFTCGDKVDIDLAINAMKHFFQSRNVVISSDQNRGLAAKPVEQSAGLPISWESEYQKKNPWGVMTSVDIYKTDPDIIRDKDRIIEFVHELTDKIGMKRYGDCQVVHFGADKQVEGFSMTQLIETSLISGHFANASSTAYIDIFSCKFYEPREIAEFAVSFFKGDHYKMQVGLRQ